MSDLATAPRFSCDGCGKSYGWKSELSKKRVKCKCGHAMTVPDLSAPPPPLPIDEIDEHAAPPALSDAQGIYDMIDAAPAIGAPKIVAAMPAGGAVVPAARVAKPADRSAASLRKPQPLGYRGAPTPRERAARGLDNIHDLKRDVYLPAGLVVGSFAVYMGWLFLHGHASTASSLGVFALVMTTIFVVKTLCMVAGAFIVAPMAGVSFGPIWTAILKLAALTMVPDVFASIVESAIGVQGAGIIASSLALGVYWVLMSVLFQLEAGEAWTVVIYFGVLRWILTFVIGMIVLGMLMGGAGAGLMSGGTHSAAVSPAASTFDDDVAQMKDSNHLLTASDMFGKGLQGAMKEPVESLRAAGATEAYFAVERDINGHMLPLSLIVEWPSDAASRKRLLAAMNAYRTAHTSDPDPIVDDGGKYAELELASK